VSRPPDSYRWPGHWAGLRPTRTVRCRCRAGTSSTSPNTPRPPVETNRRGAPHPFLVSRLCNSAATLCAIGRNHRCSGTATHRRVSVLCESIAQHRCRDTRHLLSPRNTYRISSVLHIVESADPFLASTHHAPTRKTRSLTQLRTGQDATRTFLIEKTTPATRGRTGAPPIRTGGDRESGRCRERSGYSASPRTSGEQACASDGRRRHFGTSQIDDERAPRAVQSLAGLGLPQRLRR